MPDQRRHRIEHDIGVVAKHGVEGFRCGAERNVQQIDLGALLEQLAGEMLGGSKARTCEHDLAGMFFGVGDQFLDVVGRKIRSRHDHQAGGRDLAHRREGGVGVVGHFLRRHGGDDLACGHDAERVAVGNGARDHVIAQDAAGAGLVLDHHGLAEFGLHRVRENAADDVGAAARAERDDEMNWPLRKILGERKTGDARGRNQSGGEREQELLHDDPPHDAAAKLRV